MRETSPDMAKAALIRQDSGRLSHALPDRSKFGRSNNIMTQPLREHIVDYARHLHAEIAEVRRELSELATSATPAPLAPTVFEENVYYLDDLRDLRERRRLGVSR